MQALTLILRRYDANAIKLSRKQFEARTDDSGGSNVQARTDDDAMMSTAMAEHTKTHCTKGGVPPPGLWVPCVLRVDLRYIKAAIPDQQFRFLPSESPNPMARKLSTRLDAIEQAAAISALTDSAKILLVQILARRDALFCPWRWSISKQPPIPELRRRQQEYLAGIAGVSARADGRSQWKTVHELRQRLVAAGMLRTVGANGETVSVLLTATGEATARALVGARLAGHDDATVALGVLKAMVEKHGPLVRESVLFNLPCIGNCEDWQDRVELFLPLLTAGVAKAESDTQGRILFALVDGAELPEPVAVDIAPEAELAGVYLQAYDSERAHLQSVEPRDPSEIFIPISAGLYWPTKETFSDAK